MKKLLTTLILPLALAGLASTAQAQDAAAGAKKNSMCMGCHGIPGYQASFPQVHKVPKIAGQNPKYIVAALLEYQKGARKQASMQAIAASLSPQDMEDLAAYFSQLGQSDAAPVPKTDPAPPEPVAALLTKGNCTSCHGANFSSPVDPSYPKLAGQYEDYLLSALEAYKTHDNPRVGRDNPIMGAMAAPFDAKELKILTQYISSLPSELKTVPEARFR